MFAKIDTKKGQFLEQTKAARAERAQERVKEKAAQKIQAVARGFLCRQRFKKGISNDVDKLLQIPGDKEEEYKPTLLPALEVFQTIKKYFFAVDEGDTVRFEYLCRYLLISVDSDNLRTSYVSVAMTKKHVLPWIQQLKDILWRSSTMLGCLKPESHNDMKVITVHLRLLITFTSPASWKILKGKTGEALTPGMSQLCNNVMGHLNSKGIYKILQCPPNQVKTWTVHGLWPNRGKKSVENCNDKWHFNWDQIQSLEKQLNASWPNLFIDTHHRELWKHEWTTHGTCAATLNATDNELRYFQKALSLNSIAAFNPQKALEKAGITPSCSKAYSIDAIQAAVKKYLQINTMKIACTRQRDRTLLMEIHIALSKTFNVTTLPEHEILCCTPADKIFIYPLHNIDCF